MADWLSAAGPDKWSAGKGRLLAAHFQVPFIPPGTIYP